MHWPAARGIQPLLPEISLPKISGNYTQWTSFCGLFSSMVSSNTEIAKVAKIMGCLSGDTLQLVKSLTISEDSFAITRQALTTQYKNTPLLVSAHLDQLFSSSPLRADSAGELNHSLNFVEAFNLLGALGVPTISWNCVVVYAVTHRLTSTLRGMGVSHRVVSLISNLRWAEVVPYRMR